VKGMAICPVCRLAELVRTPRLKCRAGIAAIPFGRGPSHAIPAGDPLWIDDDRLSYLRPGHPRTARYRSAPLPRTLGNRRSHGDSPDLIILDVVMPDMTGYEVCRQLRAKHGLHDTPVLLLTSLQDPQVDVLGRGSAKPSP